MFSMHITKSSLWQDALSYCGFSKRSKKPQNKKQNHSLRNLDNGKNQNPEFITYSYKSMQQKQIPQEEHILDCTIGDLFQYLSGHSDEQREQ